MKLIFEKEIKLSPKDAKTNVLLPFEIETDFSRMEIHFSYTPKVLADRKLSLKYIDDGMERYAPGDLRAGYSFSENYLPVQNLLTLSMDSPGGYAGCAHRHNPDQKHVLSGQVSSPGFAVQKPIQGIWQAVVNVHAVVTETCTFKLKIFVFDKSGVFI